MNQKLKKYISAAVGVLALLLLDQYTKILALRFLKDQPAVVILKGVFELQYLENRGAAFGMMQNQRFFFLIITVVVRLKLLESIFLEFLMILQNMQWLDMFLKRL